MFDDHLRFQKPVVFIDAQAEGDVHAIRFLGAVLAVECDRFEWSSVAGAAKH